MTLLVVPTCVLEQIDKEINRWLELHPEHISSRLRLRQEMLCVVDRTGRIPTIAEPSRDQGGA